MKYATKCVVELALSKELLVSFKFPCPHKKHRHWPKAGAGKNGTAATHMKTTNMKRNMKMKYHASILWVVPALALTLPLSLHADSTNASAKVTIESSYLNVLGPISASTATRTNITSGWQT